MSMNETWLTVLQYAEAHEVSDRTVQRWLKAGKLDGATHTNKGWLIPASTRPPAPSSPAAPAPGRDVAVPRARELAVPGPAALPPRTLLEALELKPAYLSLADAARLLGVTVAAILEAPQLFGAQPVGRKDAATGARALKVPARTVREAAGL